MPSLYWSIYQNNIEIGLFSLSLFIWPPYIHLQIIALPFWTLLNIKSDSWYKIIKAHKTQISRNSHYIFIVCFLLPHYCGQLENHLIVFFIFQVDFLSIVVIAVVNVVAVVVVLIVAVIVYLLMDFFKPTKLDPKTMKWIWNYWGILWMLGLCWSISTACTFADM